MNKAHSTGFSYVEAMVAIVLLAIIAVPAADAVKNGLDASRIAAAKAQELRCMKNAMETVLAQPYETLWKAARGQDNEVIGFLPTVASCVTPKVFIGWYQHKHDAAPDPIPFNPHAGNEDAQEAFMLYITVSAPQPGYTFTTLVAR